MLISSFSEAELSKLKEDYDNGALQHETILANLRQKHNAVIADLGDQIDQLNKAKSKSVAVEIVFALVRTFTSLLSFQG